MVCRPTGKVWDISDVSNTLEQQCIVQVYKSTNQRKMIFNFYMLDAMLISIKKNYCNLAAFREVPRTVMINFMPLYNKKCNFKPLLKYKRVHLCFAEINFLLCMCVRRRNVEQRLSEALKIRKISINYFISN